MKAKSRRGWIASLCRSPGVSLVRQHREGLAWRAAFRTLELPRVALSIPFAAKADADACCAIMRSHVPNPESMTLAEFNERFAAIGGDAQRTCDMLIAQSCRW